MTGLVRKLRDRLLSSNWEDWNHPRRAKLLTPVFVLGGGVASIAVQTVLAHHGFGLPFDSLLTVAFCVGALILGYAVLALVD
ncbi:hypothetical protein B4589_003440 [Halolamina sp. CBA1230]|uniref:hypothetical protein n=1 Tax=Halolamina sp. CBA1230 TaxID=1853690 RepID=UPI0009A174FC|nr:hypothetical protein [Halolamina sp. CBA1230]QKY19476.1 hypothetical protein B4589_003440 [Halolamina sp. CBA1230]